MNISDKNNATAGRYLCFSLGKDKYGIPLLQVKEVIGNAETTLLPQSPPHFKGIMNLRGQIISVINLRSKLKLPPTDNKLDSTIIILDFGPLSLGIEVDSVDCVTAYTENEMSPSPDTEDSIKADYILGVARTENALTLILDLKAALNAEDYKALKTQAAAA